MNLPSIPCSASQIKVTICILNWNGCKLLADCLASLEQISSDVQYETIVVDNGSTDDSVKMVKSRFCHACLIELPKNISIAEAFNTGMRSARGKYILLLNNDIVLLKGCIEEMVAFFENNPKAGALSARLLNPDGSTQVKYYPRYLPSVGSIAVDLLWPKRFARRKNEANWDEPCSMEQIPGASMMVRREVFDHVGVLDSNFTCWYEDVDFCCRCVKAGWELWYLPQARVIHSGGATFQGLSISQKSIWRFHGLIRYCSKHFSPMRYLALRLILITVLILRLPLIGMFCIWPRADVRRAWRGVVSAYLGFLLKPSGYWNQGSECS